MPATLPDEERLDDLALNHRAAAVEARVIRDRLRPPTHMTVSEWADRYRMLSPEASARPGRFSTADAPYQREFMDACADPRYTRVVAMWASQLGKTECVNNVIGFHVHLSPTPMLVMQATLEMAETWSKNRLAPMIRDTPALTGLVASPRARNSGNTMLHKQFPGGHITAVGANSPASMASRPIGLVVCDEINRYEPSAGAEGDPILIVWRRTATFPNRKRIEISSPTIPGGRIEKAHEASDQREFWVPCPHCQQRQILRWGGTEVPYGIKWERGKPAYYLCERCASEIEEADKSWMLSHGQWIAKNPESDIPGFWLNALNSPWYSWEQAVRDWLESKGNPVKLRVFVNTVLCESFDELGERIDDGVLLEHVHAYPGYDEENPESIELAPEGVAVLTRSVDVQGDRLETAVYGWGAGEEGWLLDHELIPGDPGIPFGGKNSPWNDLAQRMLEAYPLEVGISLVPAVTFVDSGGHHAGQVYKFTRPRVQMRCFTIKGSTLANASLLGKPSRNNREKAILYPVGSFTGKEIVLSRLAKILEPGPGFIHFPAWMSSDMLTQFGNEVLVPRVVGGITRRVWVQRGPNEQIDLAVYAYAALHQLGLRVVNNLAAIAAKVKAQGAAKRGETPPPAAGSGPAKSALRRGGGFVNRWRSY